MRGHFGIARIAAAAGLMAGMFYAAPIAHGSSKGMIPKEPKRTKSRSLPPRRRFAGGSIAKLNRWTGHPHEHRQEIARRQRQKARAEAKAARR